MKEKKEKALLDSAQKKELSAEQIKKRKMMVAVPLMVIPFLLCIYWIFAPSAKQQKPTDTVAGFNMDIPAPKTEGIVDDKRKAYEQEEVNAMRQDKLRTLNDYFFDLKGGTKPKDSVSLGFGLKPDEQIADSKAQKPAAIQSSVDAYKDITAQINSFYDKPKTEVVVEKEKPSEELAPPPVNTVEQQYAMMEKSFQMAAKYLNPTAPKKDSTPAIKEVSIPVERVRERTVSGLAQGQTDAELLETLSAPRNYGFNTAIGESFVMRQQNTISACIHDDQTVTDGARVRLRLLEEMKVGVMCIPKNSIIWGAARLQGERLDILIPNIEYAGNILPVQLAVYDLDGGKGIFIPGSAGVSAVKETLAGISATAGSGITFSQSVQQQLLMDATKTALQAGSQFASKSIGKVKLNLKANYKVLLMGKGN